MGAWSWQFVLERLRAAGHEARALPFRGVGERAAELSPELDNDVFLTDTIAALEQDDLSDIVLVGHSFGSLIASLVTDRVPERIGHLVIIDGGIAQDGQSIFGRIPREIVAKRQKLVQAM
jgi:pimeloyl-ACP methyl ester carboxylesterase